MDYLTQLQDFSACHAPSGDEGDLAHLLADLAAPYADTCSIDSLGNLTIRKHGSGKKLLFAAHMDSIGLIVTHIEDEGYLRVAKLGGLPLYSVLHTPFRFKNGTMAALIVGEKCKLSELKSADLYLDIGAKNRAEAEALVQLGDTAVSASTPFAMGTRLCGAYMDNRIACLIFLEVLRKLPQTNCDLSFVFTTQEEVGLRGARAVGFSLAPDIAIAVDVTLADEPDSKHQCSSKLGAGAAIKIMDASLICHPHLVSHLESLATRQGIAKQRDIITTGGTDAGALQGTRSGVMAGGISIPCRYIHSPVETVERADVQACIDLLCALIADADEGLALPPLGSR